MRNEGPFIVEWVAWQRLLGFTDIVIATNDCTDHSPALLEALAAAGWVHHLPVTVPAGERITPWKLAAARDHRAVRRAAWVFVCDVDEFLVVHRGAGRVTDLLPPEGAEPDFLGMAINWRVFGTCGVTAFADTPVHRQFLQARSIRHGLSQSVKCLFRQPRWFDRLGEHGPQGLRLEKAGGLWGQAGLRWINAAGAEIPDWQPDGPYLRRTPAALTSYAAAQVNHYMLRSAETWGLKAGTLSPVAGVDRYTQAYFARANGGRMRADHALRHSADWQAVRDAAMALPEVARLHALCCADHVAAIARKAGRAPRQDPRWQGFMAQAEAAK